MSSASLLQNILAWKYHHFSSGSYAGEDFQKFSRQFKLFLKDIMKDMGGIVLSYNKNHYDVSAFVQRSDSRIIYLSLWDVRWWFNRILVRTAAHEKDYRGGHNNTTSVEELAHFISKL